MKKIILAWCVVLAPTVTLAAPRTFEELANLAMNLINAGIGVLLMLAIVVYFYGIVSNFAGVSKGGDSKNLKQNILWGIIALFVMFSVWGILALLRNTLFGGGGASFGGDGGYEETCDGFDECGGFSE